MSGERQIKRDWHAIKKPEDGLVEARRIEHGITDNPHLPEEGYGEHTTKPKEFSTQVNKLETACIAATDRAISAVTAAKNEWGRTSSMMDEIALHVEAVGLRDPEALTTSAFNLTKERKNFNKNKEVVLAPSVDFRVVNTGEVGKAIGMSSKIDGAFNNEMQATQLDPYKESSWIHKGIHVDPSQMVMENLDLGNTFFRMRAHGPNGPGPFSAIVSVLIT